MNDQIADEVVNGWNRLFETKAIIWKPLDYASLHPTTQKYLSLMVAGSGLIMEIATTQLHGSYLFRTNDPVLCYLHHWPDREAHIWLDAGFNNIDDHTYLARLAYLTSGIPEQDAKATLDAAFGPSTGPAHENN